MVKVELAMNMKECLRHLIVGVLILSIGIGCGSQSDDGLAYFNRGVAYSEKGEWDKEIADYTEAIRLKPDDADAYYKRGVTYGEKGDSDKEIAISSASNGSCLCNLTGAGKRYRKPQAGIRTRAHR